jgi:hypothetical protein
MEDLVRYLDEIVDPTVAEFEADATSVRKAFLTCVAVFHAIDYLVHPHRPKLGNLKQNWRDESPDFALVEDVAHAFKHVIANGPNRLKASNVISKPPAYYGVAAYGLSRSNDPAGGVTLDDDRAVDLLDALRRAVAFLRQQAEAPR